MGLPELKMEFMQKASTAIERSSKGVVALILKDDTQILQTEFSYTSVADIEANKFTADNVDYIKKAFLGTPSKIIIEVIPTTAEDFNNALKILNNKKWNYLAIPGIEAAQVQDIASWIKTKRDMDHKTFKAVLPNHEGDHEGIINFATDEIKIKDSDKQYSTAEYCPRMAGIFAGLPFTRSATYYELSEVISIKESADPNADVDAGKLILINDGEDIKIASGVNSLTTMTDPKGPDWKDILIIDKMDLNRDDISTTWAREYCGKVINIYNNKMLFISSVNAYFLELQTQDNFFEPNSENKAQINLDAQKAYLQSQGVDVSSMKDQDILMANTGKKVFISANVKYTNAMQDLEFSVYMAA
jgi:hypothetical protein